MSRLRKLLVPVVAGLLACSLTAGTALAHRVNVFAYREGSVVSVEGYFVDGTPAVGSTVKVYDSSGKLVAEGKTDKGGTWSFKTEETGELKIELVASMGHKGVFLLEPENLGGGVDSGETVSEASTRVETKAASSESKIDERVVAEMVGKAVREELKPVMTTLLEIKRDLDKPGLGEVLGGLGYIIGLAGILFYVKGRKGV